MYRITIIIIASILAAACTKHGKEGVSDNDMREYELYDYYVDQYGNEGIVAAKYDYRDGDSFLKYTIVLSLDETITTWGPMGTIVYDVNENFNEDYPWGNKFGLDMNRRVETFGKEKFPAFEWCMAKNHNEKYIHSSSWMLPACGELDYDIFQEGNALDMLNEKIVAYGGTPITTADGESPCYYWTCVEDIKDVFVFADEQVQAESDYDPARRAIPISADGRYPGKKRYWTKDTEYRVRAIKYIYFACSPVKAN